MALNETLRTNCTRTEIGFNCTQCATKYNAYRRILVHVFFSQSVIIFLLNSTCIFIIFKNRRLLKNLQNIYLSGLLISHGGNGLSDILAYTTRTLSPIISLAFKNIRYMLYSSACFYTLFLSLDRFLAIKRPFFYQTLSKSFIICTNIAIMFCTMSFLSLFLINNLYGMYMSILSILIASFMLGVFNSIMYLELKKQFRNIQSTSVHNSSKDQLKSRKKIKHRQLRALKLCVFITVSYVTFWSPYMISGLISKTSTRSAVDIFLANCLEIFAVLDSIVDPLIYIYLNKTVKRKFRDFLCNVIS